MITAYDRKLLGDAIVNILNVIFAEYFLSERHDYSMSVEYEKHSVSSSGTIEKIRLNNLKEDSVIWEADFEKCKNISQFISKITDFEDFCVYYTAWK